jgi:hypothetical protein
VKTKLQLLAKEKERKKRDHVDKVVVEFHALLPKRKE